MSKITFCMLVFNSDHVLRPVLRALKPYGNIVVAEGPVDYWVRQGYTTSTDDTRKILAEEVGEANIVHGQWAEKDAMQTALEPLIPDDTTHVWLCDADELMPPEVFAAIIPHLDELDSVALRCHSFYGDFSTVLTGFEAAYDAVRIQRWYPGAHWLTHRPPTVLAPDGKPWSKHRHWQGDILPRYFHYSQVYPSQMRAKCWYYGDRGGMVPHYWDKVYVPWLLGNAVTRARIEAQYAGLHTHTWSRRDGASNSAPFTGMHPKALHPYMSELSARLALEIAKVKLCAS